MEGEHQFAALCAGGVCWLRHLWPTLGLQVEGAVTILGDNVAYLALCASHQVTTMAKRIDVIHHFATEQLQLGDISFKYRGLRNGVPCVCRLIASRVRIACLNNAY